MRLQGKQRQRERGQTKRERGGREWDVPGPAPVLTPYIARHLRRLPLALHLHHRRVAALDRRDQLVKVRKKEVVRERERGGGGRDGCYLVKVRKKKVVVPEVPGYCL